MAPTSRPFRPITLPVSSGATRMRTCSASPSSTSSTSTTSASSTRPFTQYSTRGAYFTVQAPLRREHLHSRAPLPRRERWHPPQPQGLLQLLLQLEMLPRPFLRRRFLQLPERACASFPLQVSLS